jgi:hypothetical protein
VPFGSGWRHRYAILEILALVEPEEPSPGPLLSSDPSAPQVRLAFDRTDPAGRDRRSERPEEAAS